MEVDSQMSLKAQKRCIKTTVIGIISLKTTIICCFFYNPGHRIWQPFLISSKPILDFLEPCWWLVIGDWWLVTGDWWLVIGDWWLVTGPGGGPMTTSSGGAWLPSVWQVSLTLTPYSASRGSCLLLRPPVPHQRPDSCLLSTTWSQQGFWQPIFCRKLSLRSLWCDRRTDVFFSALIACRIGKVDTSPFNIIWSISTHSRFSKKAMKRRTTLLPQSKERLHKLRFLQKLGCQKPCWDQARLSSLVNK